MLFCAGAHSGDVGGGEWGRYPLRKAALRRLEVQKRRLPPAQLSVRSRLAQHRSCRESRGSRWRSCRAPMRVTTEQWTPLRHAGRQHHRLEGTRLIASRAAASPSTRKQLGSQSGLRSRTAADKSASMPLSVSASSFSVRQKAIGCAIPCSSIATTTISEYWGHRCRRQPPRGHHRWRSRRTQHMLRRAALRKLRDLCSFMPNVASMKRGLPWPSWAACCSM